MRTRLRRDRMIGEARKAFTGHGRSTRLRGCEPVAVYSEPGRASQA